MKGARARKKYRADLSGIMERGERLLRRHTLRLAAECSARFLAALLLSLARIFEGYSPFAVSFVAGSGNELPGVFALAGAVLGYSAGYGFTEGLRYSAPAILTFFVMYVFNDFSIIKKGWFKAATASITVFIIGGMFAYGRGAGAMIYYTTDVVLAGGCTLFYIAAQGSGEGRSEHIRTAGLLILIATILIPLSKLKMLADISAGRLIATLLLMGTSYAGGMAAGSMTGVALGLAMDLGSGGAPFFSMCYSFSGLVSGVFHKQGRLAFTVSFILANAAASLWTFGTVLQMAVLFEVFVASVIFVLLPERIRSFFETYVTGEKDAKRNPREFAQNRLMRLAGAFSELGEAIKRTGPGKRSKTAQSAVFDAAAKRVCSRCTLRNICWNIEYVTTVNAFNDISNVLKAQGRAMPEDYPEYFSSRCLNFTQLFSAVNEEYALALRQKQYANRLRESREAVCRQFSDIAGALERAAYELSEEISVDEPALRRLRRYIKAMGVRAEASVFYDHNGRLRAEISGTDLGPLLETKARARFSHLIGIPVNEPEIVKISDRQRIILTQTEPLAAIAAAAACRRSGELKNGDSGTYFKNDDGKLYIVLSDGMGSGENAARESAMAVHLLERFLKAGMLPSAALRTLNSGFMLGEEKIVTTVDMLCVDLFSGESSLYKYGAAPTYIKRGNTVRRLEGRALAAGSGFGATEPDVLKIKLAEGDYAILLTDGVTDGAEDLWLRELISGYNDDSPRELATQIIKRSKEENGTSDDMTALVLKIVSRI
ncbi:MAG: SpoIIE family protein phosphatase [Oscillospiraceae bacterium]|jgi:stage II sporulation protein E